jgi:hypothetical protein
MTWINCPYGDRQTCDEWFANYMAGEAVAPPAQYAETPPGYGGGYDCSRPPAYSQRPPAPKQNAAGPAQLQAGTMQAGGADLGLSDPYVVRGGVLLAVLIAVWLAMKAYGWTKGRPARIW